MAATIDMALAMIEKDPRQGRIAHGGTQARRLPSACGWPVAVVALLELEPKSDRIQKAIDYANANLRNALPVEELAQVASLSPRQFSRAFTAETGQSPGEAIEHLRVETARLMIEQGRHSMDVIANEVGFSDRKVRLPGLNDGRFVQRRAS